MAMKISLGTKYTVLEYVVFTDFTLIQAYLRCK